MRIFYTILFFLTVFSNLFAEIGVKSFRKLETDLTARIDAPKTDQNGDVCAIIKVVTTETGFSWEPDRLGIVAAIPKVGEYWLYVPYGAKRLTIIHPQLGILRDYLYSIPIEKACVYEMVLTTGKVITTVEETIQSQWLVITPEPSNALIYINDEFVKTGEYQNKYKPGAYNYRVELPLYHTEAGRVEMGNETKKLAVKLKPAFGYISVSSVPESGAQVFVDGKLLSATTPLTTEPIASGEHTVQIVKEMYQPAVQKVTVTDGQTIPVNVTLQPNFAELTVTAPAEASIMLNNQQKGIGKWSGRLSAGVYSLEAQLKSHRAAKQDVEVAAGDKRTIELQPIPIYGSLDVVTSPSGATITINGKDYGTSPIALNKLLIGDYTVELSRQGYSTVRKSISISEGKSEMINETLQNGRLVTIKSIPNGANLYVDGESVGKTPYNGNLTIGSHVLKIESGGKTAERKVEIAQSGGETTFIVEMVKIPTVYNPKTGKTWMDRNLGASRVATSSTDAESYGDMYQWGRGTDGHEKRNSGTTGSLSNSDMPGHDRFIIVNSIPNDWRSPQNDNLWQGLNGINNPCPEGFRIPSLTELEAERLSWKSNNLTGAYTSVLKLMAVGGRKSRSGTIFDVGSGGYYWSSTIYETNAVALFFSNSDAYTGNGNRASGGAIRCIKD
jgi:uncharacterized protein (TIGR02145 family)